MVPGKDKLTQHSRHRLQNALCSNRVCSEPTPLAIQWAVISHSPPDMLYFKRYMSISRKRGSRSDIYECWSVCLKWITQNRYLCERSDPMIFPSTTESRIWPHAICCWQRAKEQSGHIHNSKCKPQPFVLSSVTGLQKLNATKKAEIHISLKYKWKFLKELAAHMRADWPNRLSATWKDARQAISLSAA